MLKPTKLSKKDKESSVYAGPSKGKGNPSKGKIEKPTPYLPTKKAGYLDTYADQPRELMKRKETVPSQKQKGLKGLIGRAMEKANSTYKKVDKTGMSGRSVSKEKGLATRTVDGRDEMVREKTKTVKRADGTVKKTVTKGKGVGGSVIGRYKDVKRYK